MKTYTEPARELPVEGEFDVIVAGSGPAGASAAVMAGRLGAKVLLIEWNNAVDGTRAEDLTRAELDGIVAKYISQRRPPHNQIITYLFSYENDNPTLLRSSNTSLRRKPQHHLRRQAQTSLFVQASNRYIYAKNRRIATASVDYYFFTLHFSLFTK